MNGGAVYWLSKAQTTVRNTTTEAEIKAMLSCVEVLKGPVDHLLEAHDGHGQEFSCIETLFVLP
jgi:hypothetical protein